MIRESCAKRFLLSATSAKRRLVQSDVVTFKGEAVMRFLSACLALCGAVLLTSQAQAQSAAEAGYDSYKRGDYSSAATLFQQACTGGDVAGCFGIGWLYFNGQGVAGDEVRAAGLFEKACAGSLPLGCTMLASMYELGQGVTKDTARALVLNRRALTLNPEAELADLIHENIKRLSAAPAR